MRLSKAGRRKYAEAKLDFMITGRTDNPYFAVIHCYRTRRDDSYGTMGSVFDPLFGATINLRARRKRERAKRADWGSPMRVLLELQNKLRYMLLPYYEKVTVMCVGPKLPKTTSPWLRAKTWVDGRKEILVCIESSLFRTPLYPLAIRKLSESHSDHIGFEIRSMGAPASPVRVLLVERVLRGNGDNLFLNDRSKVTDGIEHLKQETWASVFHHRKELPPRLCRYWKNI